MEKSKKDAWKIIILLGLIALLGDLIYEAGVSINGQYLKLINVNPTIIGFVLGFATFLGYAIRIISGIFADKTKSYGIFAIIGYSFMIFIPLLFLVTDWKLFAVFIILERIGKALRSPAKDTLLSFATEKVGSGIGFGISEVLDQIGALLGPLLMSLYFYQFSGTIGIKEYQGAYKSLFIPYIILLLFTIFVYGQITSSQKQKFEETKNIKIKSSFYYYIMFMFFTSLGVVGFSLIGYHLKNYEIYSDSVIPILYGACMIIDAIFALILGKIYDLQKRITSLRSILIVSYLPLFTTTLGFLLFSQGRMSIILGITVLGIILATHESITKAIIADLTPKERRGFAFGLYNFVYGISLLIGSSVIGFLYEISITSIRYFLIATQTIAFVFFLLFYQKSKREIFS
ncbi:MAG: MFS transporter [Candidatus Woesearchaeota archaeon]